MRIYFHSTFTIETIPFFHVVCLPSIFLFSLAIGKLSTRIYFHSLGLFRYDATLHKRKPYFLRSSVRRNHPSTCYRWALILCPQRRCTMKPSSQILRTDPWTNKIPLKEHIPRLHPNRSQKPLNTRCEESVFISRTGERIVINAENEW